MAFMEFSKSSTTLTQDGSHCQQLHLKKIRPAPGCGGEQLQFLPVQHSSPFWDQHFYVPLEKSPPAILIPCGFYGTNSREDHVTTV